MRHHFASCGSTNDEAARLAREGAPHGTVVTAGEQTAGRGRAGRVWTSPAGANLYLSMILRPAMKPAEVPGVTLAAGIAVCDAARASGVRARLKWPNDVLVGDKKLAGVLTEMTTKGDAVEHVILGIGVNVGAAPLELATSIAAETGRGDVDAFTAQLVELLGEWLARFFAGGVRAIAEDWTARADLGRRVRAGTLEGMPRGLDRDGALVIVGDDGVEARVVAGDVVET